MNNLEFLPGSARERMKDLRLKAGLNQKQLASVLGCSYSKISKIETGAIQTIDYEFISKMAEYYNVSLDFLLGKTDVPFKTTYQIDQLGLSEKAARNLFTGKVNPIVLNALLENYKFAKLTYDINLYFNEVVAKGLSAQNALLTSIGNMLKHESMSEASKDILTLRNRNIEMADIESLSLEFASCLKDIKNKMDSEIEESKKLTTEIFETMVNNITCGSEKTLTDITPQDILEQIKLYIGNTLDYTSEDELNQLINSLTPLFAPVPPKELIVND